MNAIIKFMPFMNYMKTILGYILGGINLIILEEKSIKNFDVCKIVQEFFI
jgi:hypothetical protein